MRITNDNEFEAFHSKYAEEAVKYRGGAPKQYSINWSAVAKDYYGIEISPYRPKYRLALGYLWYYGWDVASGCIWNKDAIRGVRLLKDFGEIPKESVEEAVPATGLGRISNDQLAELAWAYRDAFIKLVEAGKPKRKKIKGILKAEDFSKYGVNLPKIDLLAKLPF